MNHSSSSCEMLLGSVSLLFQNNWFKISLEICNFDRTQLNRFFLFVLIFLMILHKQNNFIIIKTLYEKELALFFSYIYQKVLRRDKFDIKFLIFEIIIINSKNNMQNNQNLSPFDKYS